MSLDYQKYYENGWKNKPDRSTPVVAEALNAIDDAIIETQEAIKGIGGKNVASAKMSTGQITDAFDGSAIVTDFTRNLIKYPYDRVSGYVSQGVTYTYDEDGTTYANGTASANSNGFSYILKASNFVLKKGKYKLYGSPSGSGNTFFQRIYLYYMDGSNLTNYTDYGRGVEFETEMDCLVEVKPYIISGYTADNIAFKPVLIEIVEGKEIPTEYIPTTGYDVRISGKNLIKPEYRDGSKGSAYTHRGVTYTVNNDGSITANGTATGGHSYFYYANQGDDLKGLKGKTITLSGCPVGGSTSTYRQSVSDYFDDGTYEQKNDNGNGVTTTLQDGSKVNINIRIYEGYTVNNMTSIHRLKLVKIIQSLNHQSQKLFMLIQKVNFLFLVWTLTKV